ncbi:hypothetical protein LJC16_02140 [Bacteroidales bacterium OttesenSCG-928-C19]|nr:hypothetical protein [Bacteroidales bacterium OttesenSCG-928-C19]
MTLFEIISLALNLLFGSGLLITLLTLRSERKKAKASAKSSWHEAQGKEIDLVGQMQESNQMLTRQINDLLKEIIEIKLQNKKLQISVGNLTMENEFLRKEVAELKAITIRK